MNLKNFYLNLSNKNKNLIPQVLTVLVLESLYSLSLGKSLPLFELYNNGLEAC